MWSLVWYHPLVGISVSKSRELQSPSDLQCIFWRGRELLTQGLKSSLEAAFLPYPNQGLFDLTNVT